MTDTLRALARETAEELFDKQAVPTVGEVDIIHAALQQAQALQREADVQLVQAMEPYLQHKLRCVYGKPRMKAYSIGTTGFGVSQDGYIKDCTCGLAALLRRSPAPHERETKANAVNK